MEEKKEQDAALARPTAAAAAVQHEASIAVAGKRLAAASNAGARKRSGLNDAEIKRIARQLADDVPWHAVKKQFADVADEALESCLAILSAPAEVEPKAKKTPKPKP